MGKLHHTPFEMSPRYPVEVSDHVRAWFASYEDRNIAKIVEAVQGKTRNAKNCLELRPRDAFRLVVEYRRGDVWEALCGAIDATDRREWGMGHAIEELWNHDLEGFCWFAELHDGLLFVSTLNIVVAMAQCQDFCTDTQQFSIRQAIVSRLAYNSPGVVRSNPHMWEFLVKPPLMLMQVCSNYGYIPPFVPHHFEHLREGSYAHFQLLLQVHGATNAAMWAEMRRFVADGPVMPDPDERSYCGALGSTDEV